MDCFITKTDAKGLQNIIIDEMFIIYVNNNIINKINYNKNGSTVILFIGVNGTGETTTISKFANKLVN